MDWISSNATALAGLGGLATVATAVVAIFTLMRAGLDSASRSRPYVVVEYEVPERAYRQIRLVVRNAGPSAARDVRVVFDPPFLDSDDAGRLGAYVYRRYGDPVSVLGPGQRLESMLMVDTDDETKSDAPPVLRVLVSYKSPWWRPDYTDTFILNRVVYEQHVFMEHSDSPRGLLKSIRDSLKNVDSHLKSIARQQAYLQETIATVAPAPDRAGVAWRIRERNDSFHVLENIGTATAYDVTVAGTRDVRRIDIWEGTTMVRPGERLKLMLRGFGSDPEIEVGWVSDRTSTLRRAWRTRLPT
ncbi:hypothetical protein [Demequina maris]|uniref:hypothetical protein n=1 Tax=Demequina maris TaxID=1638982 RepID=UPI000784269C|nr:hypothetical protein [Demequina maris]